MTSSRKENVQYTTAIGFLITGIIICFLSFFMNEYEIDSGSLWYLGQSTAFCAACFGLNLMVKNEVRSMKKDLEEDINNRMQKVDNLLK